MCTHDKINLYSGGLLMNKSIANEKIKPTFLDACLILGFLIISMGISVIWLDLSIHITMMFSAAFAVMVLMIRGFKWEDVNNAIVYGGKLAIAPILVLYVIGMLIGSWMASGTVPMIIYWGLKIINPSIFLVTSCIVCAITSFATGSSWSTAGTVGVALMGIGGGLGMNPAMTAGAIISGAYLGDKMSPLSDTTNLAPAVAEADIFDHIKSMMYTTIPGFIITIIIYFILGMKFSSSQVDASQINNILQSLQGNFDLNLLTLIPPIIIVALAIKKFPSLPTLIISIVAAILLAIFMQGESLTSIANIMDAGFVSKIGIADIDKLLSRGGLQSMHWTASLGLIGIAYGGILEQLGVLEVFLSKLKACTRSVGGLVTTTVISIIGINVVTASQYMAIVLGGRMFVGAYKEKDMLPQTLSRTLEDAGTLTSVLVPWNLCGVFFADTLGVATLSYLPYACLNWIVPLIAITFGLFNKFQWKTGEIQSTKTYRNIEVEV